VGETCEGSGRARRFRVLPAQADNAPHAPGAADEADKDQQLIEERGLKSGGGAGVVVGDGTANTHDCCAEGNFADGAEDLEGAERAVANTENDEEGEEVKESGKNGGESGAAVLKTLEEGMGASVQLPAVLRLREQIQRLEGAPLRARAVLPFGVAAIDGRLPGGGLALGAGSAVFVSYYGLGSDGRFFAGLGDEP